MSEPLDPLSRGGTAISSSTAAAAAAAASGPGPAVSLQSSELRERGPVQHTLIFIASYMSV